MTTWTQPRAIRLPVGFAAYTELMCDGRPVRRSDGSATLVNAKGGTAEEALANLAKVSRA